MFGAQAESYRGYRKICFQHLSVYMAGRTPLSSIVMAVKALITAAPPRDTRPPPWPLLQRAVTIRRPIPRAVLRPAVVVVMPVRRADSRSGRVALGVATIRATVATEFREQAGHAVPSPEALRISHSTSDWLRRPVPVEGIK